MTITNHTHSWLWWDWSKINYNNLSNLPTASAVSRFLEKDDTWEWTYSPWTFKITTWFSPKHIRIEARRDADWYQSVSFWDCYIDDDWNKTSVITYYDDNANGWYMETWLIIFVKPASTFTSATVWTIYDDWFNLNFPNNNHNISVKIYAEW